jgi:hypothetical protein
VAAGGGGPAAGSLRRAVGARHGTRHGPRYAEAHLGAVLHHEACGPGHGTGALGRIRLREAEWRLRVGGIRGCTGPRLLRYRSIPARSPYRHRFSRVRKMCWWWKTSPWCVRSSCAP